MAAFPDDIKPIRVGFPIPPSPGIDKSATGRITTDAGLALGSSWSMSFGEELASNQQYQAFLARLRQGWTQGEVFQIKHAWIPGSGLDPNGADKGSSSPLVRGADQSGDSLSTDGWTASTSNLFRAGDVIRVTGVKPILTVTADASSNATGVATLSIFPSISDGASPADDATIQYEDCEYDVIISRFNAPSGLLDWVTPFTIQLTEVI